MRTHFGSDYDAAVWLEGGTEEVWRSRRESCDEGIDTDSQP